MKRRVFAGVAALTAVGGTAIAVAQTPPRALANAEGGLWEVSREANGHGATKVCVPSPDMLAQFEHRDKQCTRVVIAEKGTTATIHYSCTDGNFGRSDITLITPRSLRINTQGISGGYPFNYQLHARRVGACAR